MIPVPTRESKGSTMLDPILVPLDGSQLAECVLPHATAIARSFDAQIKLLCILEKHQVSASAQLFDLVNWQIKKTKTSLYLEKTKIGFQESGLQAQATVAEGLVAEEITKIAQSQRVKLIILSSHGKNGLTPWGISSTSQKIILSAPTSVFIVRANQPQASGLSEIPLYQRILVPLDGSQRAENVLPVITQLARFHQSQVHLVQVVQKPELARQMPLTGDDIDLSNRLVARNQQEARHYLEQVKSRSYLEGISVQTHLITSDNAAAELHQLVDQEHINLVALSAHGYSGNHQWPYGSITNNFMMYGKSHLMIIQDLPATIGTNFRERAER
jgi:nucleotide-binding universal stress UspA family protein